MLSMACRLSRECEGDDMVCASCCTGGAGAEVAIAGAALANYWAVVDVGVLQASRRNNSQGARSFGAGAGSGPLAN